MANPAVVVPLAIGALRQMDEIARTRNRAKDAGIKARHEATENVAWSRRMGFNPSGASPSAFGGQIFSEGAGDPTAGMMDLMGQGLTAAAASSRTAGEKELSMLQLQGARADVEGKLIDNSIRTLELNRLGANKPSFPGGDGTNFMPGQGNSGLVKVKPAERTASQPGSPHQEAGWRPDLSFARTQTGLVPVVPESLSESLEDDVIGKTQWRIRNQLVPNLTGGGAPAKSQLPPGFDKWEWNFFLQEWQPGRETKDGLYQKPRIRRFK